MIRLRSIGAALVGAGIGYVAGAWATTHAHASARDQTSAAFVADSKHQLRKQHRDPDDYRTDDHPANDPAFDHERFSETSDADASDLFDPERWFDGVDIDVVAPGDLERGDEREDDGDAPSDPEEIFEELRDTLDDERDDDDDKRGTAP